MTERDRTVLLVEDDDDHASLIAATLESIGLHCTRAASLADAFAVLSEGAFALVVLDYWLGNESRSASASPRVPHLRRRAHGPSGTIPAR